MDEWVIVDYPVMRTVNVDGMANGITQAPIQVETGTHAFDLGLPADYTPKSQTVSVFGTSPMHPMHLQFTPASAGEHVALPT